MPRGPLTTAEALFTMAAALLVGGFAGLVLRTRWAALLTPVVFVAAFELGRMGYSGPTVDRIDLGSTYGILAFVLGRGLHGLLALAPMALGSVLGVKLSARLDTTNQLHHGKRRRVRSITSGVGLTLAGAGLAIFAVLLAFPASTPPIRDAEGEVVAGSVAELTSVRIGGHDQAMLIRGHSSANPVLLYLAGGPGGTDIGAHRIFWEELERDFVVVTWDQRGAGKSYTALDPVSTLTLEQVVSDAVEVANYLRDRFRQERIYLVGNSWGTILGVMVAQQHPELFHAFVGAGQMVSPTETDRHFYEATLAWSEETGRGGLVSQLLENGPPPYEDVMKYVPTFAYEREWNDYERVPEYDRKGEMPSNLFVREYNLLEKLHALPATFDTFWVLYPYLRDVDFRRDAVRLAVPVYLVQGRHEAHGRAVLADEWFELLEAPFKERVTFERSGHRPHFEEPDRFLEVMRQILEETQP